MIRLRRFVLLTAASLSTVALSGCHSSFVQATVVNHTGGVVHLFEVDYPSASFGGNELADGGTFHYRFKVLGDGPAKVTWTDASQHDHTAQGPQLKEGEEGTLALTLGPSAATWDSRVHAR